MLKLNKIMKSVHIFLCLFMQYIQRVKILKLGNSVGDRFYLLHAKIKSKIQL